MSFKRNGNPASLWRAALPVAGRYNVPCLGGEADDLTDLEMVAVGTGHQRALPEESQHHRAYIRLRPDGSFHSIRFYGEDHYATKDIAYHREPDLAPGGPILPIHEYKRDNFTERKPRLLTEAEYNLYKKYFNGALRWKA
ncbi:MAG: hypothetical protein ACI4X9_06685 [Kiritimatiellia bacterium]